jgi:hypothetical protein
VLTENLAEHRVLPAIDHKPCRNLFLADLSKGGANLKSLLASGGIVDVSNHLCSDLGPVCIFVSYDQVILKRFCRFGVVDGASFSVEDDALKVAILDDGIMHANTHNLVGHQLGTLYEVDHLVQALGCAAVDN